MYAPHLPYPFIRGVHPGCFHIMVIMNNATVNMGIQVSLSFQFFWTYTQKWNCWVMW